MPQPVNDFSGTVLLPRTDFPMRANLASAEPPRLKAWEESGVYARLRELRQGAPRWILHDGPPFANGDIHMGTALNKVLKDVWVRYKTMRGYDAPFVPGWDTHGMPIEFKVSRELKGRAVPALELRRQCRAEAAGWVDRQREQFKRLGVWADWERPYITMDPAFEAGQLDAYWALLSKGQIYRALKPVHWSWATQTALAEAELEYRDKVSTQVYVKYALEPESAAALGATEPAYAIIWTTTPWTFPASLAITANERFEYGLYEVNGEHWLMATALAASVFMDTIEAPGSMYDAKESPKGAAASLDTIYGAAGSGVKAEESAEATRSVFDAGELAKRGAADALRKTFKGSFLENLKARHPFLDRTVRFCLASYVTADAGTGLVHTAPGHGAEDYVTGVRYKLDLLCPVDEQGRYTDAVEPAELKGLRVTDPDTDGRILDLLRGRGRLVHARSFTHSYPHDWRSKQPVIFRATRQWFLSLDANGLRERVLEETAKVRWINPWGQERFSNMMKDRADWCISRQRVWGVPIYMFYCRRCGAQHFDGACYAKLRPLVQREGGDAWFDPARPLRDFLPEGAACAQCGAADFAKETDTLDVWFDSGSSSIGVLAAREGLGLPADLYLEGSDQYRGWFQSSMLVACAATGAAPYRAVLSTGWTLDAQGRAMHKSAGNAVDPLKVASTYGADVLRLWTAHEDCTADLTVSDAVFKSVADNYRRLRNTLRWLLGALADFDPARHAVPAADLPPFERWLLGRLDLLVEGFTADMEAFQLHKAYGRLLAFCAGDLSSLGFDIHKDALYTLAEDDPLRRAAQSVYHQVLQALLRLAAPVLCFTAEEAWESLPACQRGAAGVHAADWPNPDPARRDAELAADFKALLETVRPVVSKRLEEARAAGSIGHPYDAEVRLAVHSKKLLRILNRYADALPRLFVVSRVFLDDAAPRDGAALEPEEVRVDASAARKCARCWRRPGDVDAEGGLCGRCSRALGHG